MEEEPVPIFHEEDLTISEAAVVTEVGLARSLGIEAVVPLRLVRTRIRFEDLGDHLLIGVAAKRPVPPPYHHDAPVVTVLLVDIVSTSDSSFASLSNAPMPKSRMRA